jgi:hypothetical protein
MGKHSSLEKFPLVMGREMVSVSGLKNSPNAALRLAQKDLVVVMNRDQPDTTDRRIDARRSTV